MTKKLLIIIQCFIALNLFASESNEELNKIRFGGNIGVNFTNHEIYAAVLYPDISYPILPELSGSDKSLGISFEYLLGDTTNLSSSLILNLSYNSLSAGAVFGELENEQGGFPVRAIDENGDMVTVLSTTNYNYSVKYDLIDLDLFYKLNISNTKFGILTGVSIGTPAFTNEKLLVNLLTPENASFIPDQKFEYTNNNRTIIVYDTEINNINSIRFGISNGIQYEFEYEGFYIIPKAIYNYSLTDVSNFNWSISYYQLGMDVRIEI